MVVHNIMFFNQRGRVICDATKEQYIWKLTLYHLLVLQRGVLFCELDENLTENIDETNLLINCGNGRTLG